MNRLVDAQEATQSRFCKAPGCGSEAVTTRGPYAMLCGVHAAERRLGDPKVLPITSKTKTEQRAHRPARTVEQAKAQAAAAVPEEPPAEALRPRRKYRRTETLLDAVEVAARNPGQWFRVGYRFASLHGASEAARLLRRGCVPAKPPDNESGIVVGGRTFRATARLVAAVDGQHDDAWAVWIRADAGE